jgi:uncharacterized membrane-anchored protein YhcB (DUF1043 family)
MLWQAICVVVALALVGWLGYANPQPVPVNFKPIPFYAEVPVWLLGCIGAVIGILLEFALTRRLWQAQASALETARAELRRARAKAKSQTQTIVERDARIKALEEQLELEPESVVTHEEGADTAEAGTQEEDDEVGI